MFIVGHQVSAKVGSGLSLDSPGVLVQTGSKQNGVGMKLLGRSCTSSELDCPPAREWRLRHHGLSVTMARSS